MSTASIWGAGRWAGWIPGCGLLLVAAGLLGRGAERPEAAPEPGVPVGTILAYAGGVGTLPENGAWMVCDGRELPVSAYPELHGALGQGWGGVEGGTFRIPDLRGRFLRGLNAGASGALRDPDAAKRFASAPGGNTGDAVGSLQESATGPHGHALVGVPDATGPGYGGELVRLYATKVPDENAPIVRNLASVQAGDEALETRPVNAAVQWIIRVR